MPMSGTGSLGMETCLVNLVEPGDRVLVGVNGVFGQRLAEVARRAGAEVVTADCSWGRALDVRRWRARLPAARSSCFAWCTPRPPPARSPPSRPFASWPIELGALLLVDAVTSLGGVPVDMDAVGVDALYSGTQKCLSCPPGLSPVSFSPRAMQAIAARKTPVQSWYVDISLIAKYWGGERLYHHTAPINMLYGLHEALRLALLEGLPARYARHRTLSAALGVGLEALGLAPGRPRERAPAPAHAGRDSRRRRRRPRAPPLARARRHRDRRRTRPAQGQRLAHRSDGRELQRAQRHHGAGGPAGGPRERGPSGPRRSGRSGASAARLKPRPAPAHGFPALRRPERPVSS